MGAEIDRLEVIIESQASKANQQLDALETKLNKIASALSGINGSGLVGLSNGVAKLSSAMQSMSNVKTAEFTRLTKNIQKLTTLNTADLNRIASSLSHVTRASNNAGQIGDLAKNISKLGNKSMQNAITTMPQLASSLNNFMQTLSKAPMVSNNLIYMTNALANLASQGSKVGAALKGLGGAEKTFSGVSAFSISAGSADSKLKKFITTLGSYVAKATIARNRTRSLAQSFGLFYASFFPIIRGIKAVGKAVESSMDYIETYNYFNIWLKCALF